MFDIVIIGAGISGLTASLYSLRSGLKCALIEKNAPGGQLLKINNIENFPGFDKGISGQDLTNNTLNQVFKFKNLTFFSDKAKLIKKLKHSFKIKLSSITIKSKSIILATGGSPKKLNIPGENKFNGKGVSYCSICDGLLFKEKIICVIGGGDSALENSIYLSKIAKKVYLIHRRNEFKATKLLINQIKKYKNIKIILNTIPICINGRENVDSISIKNLNNSSMKSLKINGIFIAIGQTINTEEFKNFLKLDKLNAIIVSKKMETNINGIFACGDVISKNLKQISTAIGDAAYAAQNSFLYIKNNYK